MITHPRTWLELKVGDDPRHQHLVEVILQVRPCDIAWFQKHETTTRRDLLHVMSNFILPRSAVIENELESYYRKNGFVLDQQSALEGMDHQSKSKIISKSTKQRRKDGTANGVGKKRIKTNNTGKKTVATTEKLSKIEEEEEDDDDNEDDNYENVARNTEMELEKEEKNTRLSSSNGSLLLMEGEEKYHQAVGTILRVVYRAESIGSSSSSSTVLASTKTCTLFGKMNKCHKHHHDHTHDHHHLPSLPSTKRNSRNDGDDPIRRKQSQQQQQLELRQLPKLSQRFWLWCYPKQHNKKDDIDDDNNCHHSYGWDHELMLPGWRRQDMIPMASLFRPPVASAAPDDDNVNEEG